MSSPYALRWGILGLSIISKTPRILSMDGLSVYHLLTRVHSNRWYRGVWVALLQTEAPFNTE